MEKLMKRLSLDATVGSLLVVSLLTQCARLDDTESSNRTAPTQTVQQSEQADGGTPISEANLREWTTTLSSDAFDGRDEGTEGSRLARTFLIDTLTKCGVDGAVDGQFEQAITTGAGTNILGRINGSDPALAEHIIILSAHYDHLGNCDGAICNGANDNAAAVASVVAVACELAQHPPRRSVLIALWDAEEPPTFLKEGMGSAYYVGHPVVPLAETDAVLVLDLVGSNLWSTYRSHFVMGAEKSPQLGAALDAATAPAQLTVVRAGLHLAEETPNGRQPWSDYDAFRNQAIPFLFFSDGQNKNYHEVNDEASLLDFGKLRHEANWLLAVSRKVADSAERPAFNDGGRDDARDAEGVVGILEAALAPRGLADTLNLGWLTRYRLKQDLSAAKQARSRTVSGTPLSSGDVQSLRKGAQRVMCLAGSGYSTLACSLFL
jgi:hypothetical protein